MPHPSRINNRIGMWEIQQKEPSHEAFPSFRWHQLRHIAVQAPTAIVVLAAIEHARSKCLFYKSAQRGGRQLSYKINHWKITGTLVPILNA